MAEKNIVLCDTNVLVEFLKNNPDIHKDIRSIGEDSLCISTITAAELYFGALNKNELIKIKKRLEKIVHVPIHEKISNIFEDFMFKYSLSHKLSIPDAIIAATAHYYDLELYTINVKDFKFIDGIKFYIPTEKR